MKKYWLNNKTIILTGVTSGIGKELAKLLILNHNCRVIGIGRRKEVIEEIKSELGNKKGNLIPALFDVSKEENWIEFASNIKKNKQKIDILINNAGILPKFKKFEKYSIEDAKSVMETNFMASVYSTKYLLHLIKKSSSPAII